ncbi:MAG TPA: hypothetical protein VL201_04250 [Patescibacteria group bacterium]|nr:hypothetical protein [Patescibacteria group bacterium]
MAKQYMYPFLCLFYLTMASSTFTSQNNCTPDDPLSMKTTIDMFNKSEQLVKDCALCLHFRCVGNSHEVYYYRYLTSTNKTSFIRAEPVTVTSDTDFETCLDKTIVSQSPDHVEIICEKSNALTVNFYKKTKQIINEVMLFRSNSDAFNTIEKLLDVKEPRHPLKLYSSPSTFLDQVKKVTYKDNSFYPKKILIYTGARTSNISNTWQENVVQIVQWISIPMILYFLLKTCCKYKK